MSKTLSFNSEGCHHAHCCAGAHSKSLARAQAVAPENNIYRLPRTVVPSHYDITIAAVPDRKLFHGDVKISVDVLKATSTVLVNAKNLVISSARARHESGTVLSGTVSLDADREMAEIKFDGTLGKSAWTLELEFAGQNSNNGQGFFANQWKDADDVEHNILCTQFESADARSAFPCFDEPDFKATFKVRLNVPEGYTALSNGDIMSVTPIEGPTPRKLVEFEPTLKMSTYVVCFVVGELVSSKPFYVNNKRMQIWAVPGNEDRMEFGQHVASFGLDYFEQYFETPYPFGHKIDLVAIPDFAWGGMENVGLVVFQPRLLLADKDSSEKTKAKVCGIIMHELAHQWFGDLVTMRWWNGLWLNESFATFMQYKASDAFNSAWKSWDKFGEARELAYFTDSVRTSHPIEETVERGGDAILLVDAISYQKGCSVLYQTEALMGAEVLRQGICLYLREHAFGNTESGDLWNSLEAACRINDINLPIRSIMEAWIFQVGHPEVIVAEGKKSGTITLTQRPFLLLERGRKTHKRWPIPVIMKVTGKDGSVVESKFVLSERTRKITVGDYQQVKVNAGGSGFYRVRYTPSLLSLLAADVDGLEVIERWNLLADASAFFNASLMEAGSYLDFLFKMANSKDGAVWWQVSEGLDKLASLCEKRDFNSLHKVVVRRFEELADEQHWNLNAKSEVLLPVFADWKPHHLNLNPMVQKLSMYIYRAWRKNPDSVDEVMAGQAALVLHFANANVVGKFRALTPKGMGVTPLQIQQYLFEVVARRNRTVAPRGVKALGVFEVVANIILAVNDSGAVVERFMADWSEYLDGETPPIHVINMVQYAGLDKISNPALEKKLKAYFKRYPSRTAAAVIARTMEHVRANVIMREKQSAAIKEMCRVMRKELRNPRLKRKIKITF